MKRSRLALAASGSLLALGVSAVACVDLFHGTDFETLCTRSPNDPACGADSGTMSDVAVDALIEADTAAAHPDFCAWTSAEARTQALRACAWLGACEGPLGESGFGSCVVRARLAYDCITNPALRPRDAVDAFWGCLSTVQSCGDVDRCVFPGGVQTCNAIATGSASACGSVAANAAVRLECAGPAGRAVGVEPCAMLGKTCVTEDESTATCAGSRGFGCLENECSGTSAVDCIAAGTRQLDRGSDCAGYGAGSCSVEDAAAVCAPGPVSAACTGEARPVCDGDTVTSCVAGRQIRVHCGRLDLPCDATDVAPYDVSEACVDRSATACTGADTCASDDTEIESCGRGAVHKLICATAGLGKCRIGANGRASCAPPP